MESHLFGHSRGAFTGAERAREGLLLAAHKGTLFLDEVGDLPLVMQGAFLRALELRRFRPVGEVHEVDSDFRLVAATNRDLEGMARTGQFRGDLLYRLQGITIVIPPLRERRDEIPGLARQAVTAFCLRNDLPEKALAEPVLDMLMEYPWPGNVRELRNAVESAFNLCTGSVIQLSDIPRYIFYHEEEKAAEPAEEALPDGMGLQEAVRRYEKGLIVRTLEQSRTITEAAEKLKLTRQALQYKMMKYHLNT